MQILKLDHVKVFSERMETAYLGFLQQELSLKRGEKKQINPMDFMSHAISRISCLCFAGSRVGNNGELVAAMARITENVIKAGVLLRVFPGWIGDLIVRRYMSIEHQLDLLMEILVPFINGLRSGKIPDDETTFISILFKLRKSDGSLRSAEHAALWFRDVGWVSVHNSAQFTTFALYELACRPQLVKELHDEISKLDIRTPEAVNHVQMLDSFLREVLRCNVDNLGFPHMALQDFVLSTGHVIPKGILIIAAMDEAHNDSAFAQPSNEPLNVLDPYRFMNTTEDKRSSTIGMDFVTFGLGPHASPNRSFAINEIKYVLAELIMRYNITTPSGSKRAPNDVAAGLSKFPPNEPIILEGI